MPKPPKTKDQWAPPTMTRKVPTDPPFTYQELKHAIPEHCFERSPLKSFGYLGANLLGVFLAYWVAAHSEALVFGPLESLIPALVDGGALTSMVHGAFWIVYWIVQGALCTGIWVIAHECGHRAFSTSVRINDTVGLILHSALLVPYHSWRISHGLHHRFTNSLEKDEVFVPKHVSDSVPEQANDEAKDPIAASESFLVHSWLGRVVLIGIMLVFGWPAYLWAHVDGQPRPGWVNHFSPYSPLFTRRQRRDIVISDLGLLVVGALLCFWIAASGFTPVLLLFGIPYLVVNFWLVLITFLHHADEALPHYDETQWTWIKGALSTVDRDYGVLNVVFHHIADTHVVHHLFHKIPHYHAVEATQHLKAYIGDYYYYDDTPIFRALWRSFTQCVFVKDNVQDPGVYWWVGAHQLKEGEEAEHAAAQRREAPMAPPATAPAPHPLPDSAEA